MLCWRSQPDFILLAGCCHTFWPERPLAQALAVADGRIVAVGSRRGVRRLARSGTRLLDFGRAAVTPGLVDCHTHFFRWALSRQLVIDVSALHSLNAVLHKITRLAATRRVGEWILAHGFEPNRWAGGLPSAADLDRAVPNHPVMVRSRDGHTAWLNTVAMKRAAITRHTPAPKGGRYLRDAHGNPTGIVQESALEQLPDPLREFARRSDGLARRVIDRALEEAYREAWVHGVVGIHTMDERTSLGHLQRHRSEGRLGLRVVHAVQLEDFDAVTGMGLRSGFGDGWLRLGGVKVFADGSLGSRTAYMLEAYPGVGDYCGVPVVTGEELVETACRATRHGWAVWIHAIGDRATREAVTAIAAARKVGTAALPHRIEHAQCVRPRDIRRMAQAGIVASIQPCHLLGDMDNADAHWPRARRHAYPWRQMLDAGVVLAAGSDVPVESIDPRRSLFAATTRMNERRRPTGGWFPGQRITTREVLWAFTRGAAAAAGAPPPAGTLAPGAPADLTIWRDDPLAVPPDALLEIEIIGCMVGGQLHTVSDAER